MSRKLWFQIAGAIVLCAAGILAVSIPLSSHAVAQTGLDSRVILGLNAAPFPLHMAGKNVALVGLGSYYVNVVGDCDGCHSAGPPTEYAPGGNPYFNQPKVVNPKTYLGGGRNFGPMIPNSAPIISRNLTPDASGLPIGGDSLDQFINTIRTGIDPDHLHPPCTAGIVNANCIPAPFDGNLLQVMPWPNLRNLSDYDLSAIYEYLSTIPCVQGNDPRDTQNRCGS
ncbi:MAG TPA: hypothetical protein VF730_10975 [Terracidiphilus sp.]